MKMPKPLLFVGVPLLLLVGGGLLVARMVTPNAESKNPLTLLVDRYKKLTQNLFQPKEEDVQVDVNTNRMDLNRPYSVLVKSYRQLDDAVNAAKRLKKMKYDAYVVSRMGENNNIWHDVRVGSFTNQDEANSMKDQLVAEKLPNAKVENLSNFYENVMAYQNASDEDKQEVVATGEIPDISTNVIITMRKFPVDKNFKIAELRLADIPLTKVEKMRDIGFSLQYFLNFSYIPQNSTLRKLISDGLALSQAIYEDKLFDKRIGVLVLMVTNTDEILTNISFGDLEVSNIAYKTTGGILKGDIYTIKRNESNFTYTFFGKMEGQDIIVVYRTYDMALSELTTFVSNNNQDKGLLIYPEVIRGLSVFPKDSNSEEHQMATFGMYRLPWSYAKERNYAWWANNMVGHWALESWYLAKSIPVSISFYNVLYKKTASAIHRNFVNEKKKAQSLLELYGIENCPVDVRGESGWYLNKNDLNEVSFGYGPYIIAVNTQYPHKLSSQRILDIISNLNIWALHSIPPSETFWRGGLRRTKTLQENFSPCQPSK